MKSLKKPQAAIMFWLTLQPRQLIYRKLIVRNLPGTKNSVGLAKCSTIKSPKEQHAEIAGILDKHWGVPAGADIPIRTGKYTSSISDDIVLPHRLMEYVVEWSIDNGNSHIKERFGKQFVHRLNREEFYNVFHTIITEDSLLLLKKDENDA